MNARIGSVLAAVGLSLLLAVPSAGQEKTKSLVETGIEHYKSGQYEEAIKVLKEVIRTSIDENDNHLAYLYLGYTYFSLPSQEMANAQAYIEKAIATRPDYILRADEFVSEFLAFYKNVKESMTGIGFFESDPSPAGIFLDDRQIGSTPMKKEILAKIYFLRAVKWGYTPYEAEIEIKKTEVTNFKIPFNAGKNWKTFIRTSLVFGIVMYLLKTI